MRRTLAVVATLLFLGSSVRAAMPTVEWYETSTASGTENSKTIVSATANSKVVLNSIGCYNYDTSNPKVIMLFDATSVPTNGTVATRGMVPIETAPSAALPGYNALTIPLGGITFVNGITFAVSTTGKTLTVDTTSGGNVHCVASYSPFY